MGMNYERMNTCKCSGVPKGKAVCPVGYEYYVLCLTELVPQLHCLAAANDNIRLPVHRRHDYVLTLPGDKLSQQITAAMADPR